MMLAIELEREEPFLCRENHQRKLSATQFSCSQGQYFLQNTVHLRLDFEVSLSDCFGN